MLTYDPAQRLSAREALDDPWIQKNQKNIALNKKVLENLSSFSVSMPSNGLIKWYEFFQSKNKLKQAILTFIVTQVTTQAEKDELQKVFQQLDKDKNGILTRDELVEGKSNKARRSYKIWYLHSKGYVKVFGTNSRAKAEQEANRIIQEVDVNCSGQIDFSGRMLFLGFN